MAYVLFVFDRDGGRGDCLYLLGGRIGEPGANYVSSDLDFVVRVANSAAGIFSAPYRQSDVAQYAVLEVSRSWAPDLSAYPSPHDAYPLDAIPWVGLYPVAVPSFCDAAARARFGLVMPVPGVAPSPVPGPVADPSWAFDPYAPCALEDGTPVEVLQVDMEHPLEPMVKVRPLCEPTGPYAPDWSWGWWHDLATGHWSGDKRYLKVRNVNAADRGQPRVYFEVRAGRLGTDRNEWSIVKTFPDGKAAAVFVGESKAEWADRGKSLCIVKVEVDPSAPAVDWRAREAKRMADGTYTPLPGEWAAKVAEALPDHFAHVSQGDKYKVAFTESDSAGERDRQKVLSASEYWERHLHRLFGSRGRDAFMTAMYGGAVKPLFVPLGDVEALVSTYRECETNGYCVDSCMTHETSCYSSRPHHPVSVYALGGDLTLAFLRGEDSNATSVDPSVTDWDAPGRIVARCLAWPERKEYGRVYGSTDAARLLRNALEHDGYRQTDLDGARLGKVEHRGHVVMPYLDCGSGTFSDSDDPKFLLVGGDAYQGQSTGGLAQLREPRYCDHCDEYHGADDFSTVRVDRYGNTEAWCESCTSSDAVYCDETEEMVPDHAATEAYSRWGNSVWVADWALEDNYYYVTAGSRRGEYHWGANTFVCDDCEETFHTDDMCSAVHGVCSDCYDNREAESEETEAA